MEIYFIDYLFYQKINNDCYIFCFVIRKSLKPTTIISSEISNIS